MNEADKQNVKEEKSKSQSVYTSLYIKLKHRQNKTMSGIGKPFLQKGGAP